MKTEIINVFPSGEGRDAALELTEKTGAYCGIDSKASLRLRLLSEELIELVRALDSENENNFWLETNGNNIEIHLKTVISMDLATRNELLSVSSSGKNEAAKGIIGRIREMITVASLPEDPETKIMTKQALGLMALGNPSNAYYGGAYSWSLATYSASVGKASSTEDGITEAQDELEKSIVANLADDVKVTIVDSNVEVVIYKAYK
jgi:hypothetical protein